MKSEEWSVLAMALKTAYQSQNFMADEYAVKLWYNMLKDLEYEPVNAAVNQYILQEHFPPAPADIRKRACELAMPDIPDWSEGYREMQLAIRYYGYMQEDKALESMSEVTRAVVKRLGWMNICTGNIDNEVADRANFRTIYNEVASRKKAEAATPEGLRLKIKALQAKALEQLDQKLIGEKQ